MKKEFIIPVEWVSYSTVSVEAENEEEALKIFNKQMDDIPLPSRSEYVDESFRIPAHDYDNDVDYIKECQDYQKIGDILLRDEAPEFRLNTTVKSQHRTLQ